MEFELFKMTIRCRDFFDVLSCGYTAYVYLHVNGPSGQEIEKFTAEKDGEYSFCLQSAYTETEMSFWVSTESGSALTKVAKEGT